jgi:hypothetical protein
MLQLYSAEPTSPIRLVAEDLWLGGDETEPDPSASASFGWNTMTLPQPLFIATGDDLTAVAVLLQLPAIAGDAPHGALVAFPSRKVAAVFPLHNALPRAALDVMVHGLDHEGPAALTRTVYWWRLGGDQLIELGPILDDEHAVLHIPDELAPLLR